MGWVPTVTSAATAGTPSSGPLLLPPARAHPRGQPVRLLARARGAAAVLPPLLPPDPSPACAPAGRGAVHRRRQPPVVPRPVRHRHAGTPAGLLRGQAGALPQPLAGVVPELPRRLPDRPRRR